MMKKNGKRSSQYISQRHCQHQQERRYSISIFGGINVRDVHLHWTELLRIFVCSYKLLKDQWTKITLFSERSPHHLIALSGMTFSIGDMNGRTNGTCTNFCRIFISNSDINNEATVATMAIVHFQQNWKHVSHICQNIWDVYTSGNQYSLIFSLPLSLEFETVEKRCFSRSLRLKPSFLFFIFNYIVSFHIFQFAHELNAIIHFIHFIMLYPK